MKRRLYCFDFDGTLTDCDSFVRFVMFSRGWWSFVIGMVYHGPMIALMKLKLLENWKVKERVFSYFFRGMSSNDYLEACRSFAEKYRKHLRKIGLLELKKAIKEGAEVYIVSASMSDWVKECLGEYAHSIVILATEVEVKNGEISGRFKSRNCYGLEKVVRIQKAMSSDRKKYYILAYGDSRGDREMFEYADEVYYKPFRKGWKRTTI